MVEFALCCYSRRTRSEPSTADISLSVEHLKSQPGEEMDASRWFTWLLLPALGQLLLNANQVDSSTINKTINIGYMKRSTYIAGAINVAIEKAQNDGLLCDYSFRYK